MKSHFILFLFVASVLLDLCVSSAIPMWEYLKKEEKMSYIYSMFANQVEDFCTTTTSIPNCNQEFLKYGLNKLKDMSEDHLDAMDPYQRGANNIIWESMMAGHEMVRTTPKPRPSTTAKPNSYDAEPFEDFEFGAHGSASAKIDNVYRVPPPKGFVFKAESGQPHYTYPHNVVPYLSQFEKTRRPGAYTKFQQQYRTSTEGLMPLIGPMVVRVYPDGRPVQESQPLPQDDDLRQYQWSQIKLPNF